MRRIASDEMQAPDGVATWEVVSLSDSWTDLEARCLRAGCGWRAGMAHVGNQTHEAAAVAYGHQRDAHADA